MLVVATFYRFFRIDSCQELKADLEHILQASDIYGAILLAHEGINGTVCGSRASIDRLASFLKDDPRFSELEYKESFTEKNPFIRRHVKIKDEIVTLGEPNANPDRITGRHVSAREWDELLADPSVLVLDVRNQYETALGGFVGARDPQINNFREFPDFVKNHLDPQIHTRVAMSCTGGIRCEKASSYMAQLGFREIYQLKGGVLQYLQDTPKDQSNFRGECFVFDHRVAVDHDLKPGSFSMCFGCRAPVSTDDKNSGQYIESAACPKCRDTLTPQKIDSKRARHKQIALAKTRGQSHLGPLAMPWSNARHPHAS